MKRIDSRMRTDSPLRRFRTFARVKSEIQFVLKIVHQSKANHKPNSVEDDHLSGIRLTPDLKQPTRESNETGSFSSPIWSCSGRGLPCVPCYQGTGGLLPHLFTLVPQLSGTVYFLWHFP